MKQCVIKFNRKLKSIYLLCLVFVISLQQVAWAETALYEVSLVSNATHEQQLQDFLQIKALLEIVQQNAQPGESKPLQLAKNELKQAEMALSNKDQQKTYSALSSVHAQLKNIQLERMPSRSLEWRAMFMDAGSIGKTTAEIYSQVKALSDAGFNVILPEVMRRGYTLYPKSHFTDQDPEFAQLNFDPLAALSAAAKKYKLKVVPWVWVFRVSSPGYGNPILNRIPAFAARPEVISASEETPPERFLSPAFSESREYMGKLFRELVSRYEPDGLLLDYIRYDELIPEDQASVSRFRLEYLQEHGVLPDARIGPEHPLFLKWQLWRENQVHEAVKYFYNTLKPLVSADFKIGAAVFRGERYSRLAKMQHWRHWVDQKWVQFVVPMLYTANPKDLKTWLSWVNDKGTRHDWLYPGLGAHRFTDSTDIFAQLGVLHQENIPGVSVFALSHFDTRRFGDLKQGYFRQEAQLPHDIRPFQRWSSTLKNTSPKTEVAYQQALKQIYRTQAQKHTSGVPQTISLAPLPETQALPEAVLVKTPQAPQIDGEFTEAMWQKATRLKVGHWYNGLARAGVDTEVLLAYDAQALYVAFINEEPELSLLKAKASHRDHPDIFKDDSIELMLAWPDSPYYHFVLNTQNVKYDAKTNQTQWNGAWRSTVTKQTGQWQAEIMIPWSALGKRPSSALELKANFFRTRYADQTPFSAWSVPFGNYHRPKRFGSLKFDP